MAAEILVCTPAIRALIRDDKIHQIYSMMQSGKKHGMQTMNDALFQQYTNREVTQEECERVSHDPKEFLRMIGVTPMEEQEIGQAPGERKLTGGVRR
jgi:twitching motility protein PilT